MGASQSSNAAKNPAIELTVKVDKEFYHAGQELKGKIILNAKDHIKYDTLLLKLIGHEYTHWGVSSSCNYIVAQNHDSEAFQNQNIIAEFADGIKPGKYVYTFYFKIKQELPKTYFLGEDFQFTISFPLKAVLIDSTNQIKEEQHVFYINIVDPILFKKHPFSHASKIHPKILYNCFNAGYTWCRVNYPKNKFKTNQPMILSIQVNNKENQHDISFIQVTLYEYIYKQNEPGSFKFHKQQVTSSKSKQILAGEIQTVEIQIDIPDLQFSTHFGTHKGHYYTLATKIHWKNVLIEVPKDQQIHEHIYIQSQKQQPYTSEKLSMVMIQSSNHLVQQEQRQKIGEQIIGQSILVHNKKLHPQKKK